MKIIINQRNLSRALNLAGRIISKNLSLPILNNILLKTENGRLKLSATNLELGISCYLGVKTDETGEIAVPAKIFADFVNNLNEDKIYIATKNNILNIDTAKHKTQILGHDPKEFPLIPKIKEDFVISIPAKTLKLCLEAISDSIAISETRPELAGVFIQFNSEQATFAATDSFRLAEKTIDLKSKHKIDFILPRITVLELIRILGDIDEPVLIKYGDNQISFSINDVEVVSRLIEGNYPDYKKIIPDKYISRILINKNELEKQVRLAGLFSSNISDIKISCAGDLTTITSKSSDKGEIQVNVETLLKNDPFDLSLNYYYLLDGLKIIPTKDAIIEYTGQGSPLVIRPDNGKDLVYIIMPLRK